MDQNRGSTVVSTEDDSVVVVFEEDEGSRRRTQVGVHHHDACGGRGDRSSSPDVLPVDHNQWDAASDAGHLGTTATVVTRARRGVSASVSLGADSPRGVQDIVEPPVVEVETTSGNAAVMRRDRSAAAPSAGPPAMTNVRAPVVSDSNHHDELEMAPTVSPSMVRAFGRIANCEPHSFHTAYPPTYQEYLALGDQQPVYGIPVVYQAQAPPPPAVPPMPVPPPHPGHEALDGYPQNGGEDLLGVPIQQELVEILRRERRNTMIYCVVDVVVVALLSISVAWVSFLVIFPVCGLIGAWYLRHRVLAVYLSYFPLIIAARAYVAFVTIDANESDRDKQAMLFIIVMCVLGGVAEMYIGYVVVCFRRRLRSVDVEVLEALRPHGAQCS